MNPTKINREKILKKLESDKSKRSDKIQPIPVKNNEDVQNIQNNNIKKHIKTSNLSTNYKALLPSLSVNYYNKDYIYKINSVLNQTSNIKSNKLIHICIFNIIENIQTPPFILYLLNKDINSNVLYFPHFKSSDIIQNIAQNYIKDIFRDWKTLPNYKGYIEENDDLYLFYESIQSYTIMHKKYKDIWWWVSLFEITNIKTILNFTINSTVYNIFYKNPLLISLFDNNNNRIEVPYIGYFGSYSTYISFISAFGLPKVSPEAYLGPYYYFDTYNGAGRHAIWNTNRKPEFIDNKLITIDDNGRYKHGGLVRFVVFSSKIKYLLNRQTDKDDDSKISIELAKKVPFIKSTLKVRDVMGKWADNYDMVYVGSVLIKSDKYKDRVLDIQLAVRDYYQQYPISYHYINTNQFGETINDSVERKNLPFSYKDYDIE